MCVRSRSLLLRALHSPPPASPLPTALAAPYVCTANSDPESLRRAAEEARDAQGTPAFAERQARLNALLDHLRSAPSEEELMQVGCKKGKKGGALGVQGGRGVQVAWGLRELPADLGG